MIIKITGYGVSLYSTGRYKLKYRVGKITEAIPGTVGIFCYDNSFNPWLHSWLRLSKYSIYEVEGIGESIKNFIRSRMSTQSILDFFYKKSNEPFRYKCGVVNSDFSMVCFPAVKVIRELDKEEFIRKGKILC